MAAIEINPFDATTSILQGLPPGPIAESVNARMNLPATRRDLLDIVTAQADVNVTILAALLAVWQQKDADLINQMEALIGQVQQVSVMVGSLTARVLTGDDANGPSEGNLDG